MATKKKRKPRDGTDRILTAAGAYVAGLGGAVIVAGPVSITQWPGDRKGKFSVVVECVGRLPPKAEHQGETK